jgi:L-methionine (R)-S-oxide reductase
MTAETNAPDTESTDYAMTRSQLAALLDGEPDPLANTANFVALLFEAMPRINWLGVYLARGGELVLGPFQGKPACTRIAMGSGVCGTAAKSGETQRVADVHAFEGHIACDPASRSELVVPLYADGTLIGVLDIDSPFEDRFDERDEQGVEALCRAFEETMGEQRLLALRSN